MPTWDRVPSILLAWVILIQLVLYLTSTKERLALLSFFIGNQKKNLSHIARLKYILLSNLILTQISVYFQRHFTWSFWILDYSRNTRNTKSSLLKKNAAHKSPPYPNWQVANTSQKCRQDFQAILDSALTVCNEPNLGRKSPLSGKACSLSCSYKCSTEALDHLPVLKFRRVKLSVVPRFCGTLAHKQSVWGPRIWLTLSFGLTSSSS